jgi:hypothetical protein
VYASFFFSVRGPLAHSFYVTCPVAFVYAAHCWQRFASSSAGGRWRARLSATWAERVAAVVLASGVVMHTGLSIDRAPRRSLYLDRPLVQSAISSRNDRFLGDRRDSLLITEDHRARSVDSVDDAAAYDRATARNDLALVRADWAPLVFGQVSRFSLSIRNAGTAAAYLDIRYTARYRDDAGSMLETRQGVIKEILQPGASRSWDDLTDGLVPNGATSATLSLDGAEKCIPAERPRSSW